MHSNTICHYLDVLRLFLTYATIISTHPVYPIANICTCSGYLLRQFNVFWIRNLMKWVLLYGVHIWFHFVRKKEKNLRFKFHLFDLNANRTKQKQNKQKVGTYAILRVKHFIFNIFFYAETFKIKFIHGSVRHKF